MSQRNEKVIRTTRNCIHGFVPFPKQPSFVSIGLYGIPKKTFWPFLKNNMVVYPRMWFCGFEEMRVLTFVGINPQVKKKAAYLAN